MIISSTVASKMIIVLRAMKRMILTHFNSCSRVVISNDNDISQDDHSINQE